MAMETGEPCELSRPRWALVCDSIMALKIVYVGKQSKAPEGVRFAESLTLDAAKRKPTPLILQHDHLGAQWEKLKLANEPDTKEW